MTAHMASLEGLLGRHQLAEHFGILLLLADLALHGLTFFVQL